MIIWIVLHQNYFVGFSAETERTYLARKELIKSFEGRMLPKLPPLKVFKPKSGNLPILSEYTKKLPAAYWSKWHKRTFDQVLPSKSWVDPLKLSQLAEGLRYGDADRLQRVLKRLRDGADIGCRGRGREPTKVPNSPSVYTYGDRVADALQQWIEDGIAVGPLREEDIPWENITISPMMVKIKPSGAARIIVNMSSPDTKMGPGAVNKGIDKNEFEAKMSSTAKFVESLARIGVGALMCKSDWNQAYKHVHIREEDIKLQFIEFGGRLFAELMLVFGAVSSPGIYDDLAKIIVALACLKASFPKELVQQHLDDVCACGPANDGRIYRFDKAYREVSDIVGVSLADRSDPDKSFAPATCGIVLGVVYDTVDWTWHIREDKLARICDMLNKVVEGRNDIDVHHMLSLAGKLVDIKLLIKGGKFHLGHILASADSGMDKQRIVDISNMCRAECHWWLLNVQGGAHRSLIRRPYEGISTSAIKCWTDAAGGSLEKIGHGLGGIIPPHMWFYLPWPQWLNKNHANSDGVKFSRKLTCLETLGPLVAITLAPDMVRNQHMVVYVDNQGSCDIFRKGYSTSCFYSGTLVRAMHEVAGSLNCTLHVKKITRCSDAGALAADLLSKAEFAKFDKLMPTRNKEPSRILRVILNWLGNPKVSLTLGEEICKEMAKSTKMLGY